MLLAGCGGDTSGGDVSTEPRPTGSASGPATGPVTPPGTDPGGTAPEEPGGIDPVDPTDLRVTVDTGDGQTRTYTLRCDPAGGDHPDPAAACEALARM